MIEFIPDCHLYINSLGIIIPSVSQLVAFATGDDYSCIPKHILKNACDFGTDIHEAIEQYFDNGSLPVFDEPYRKLAFNEFLKLKDDIENPKCEMMIDYEERYAGRIDILDGEILIDTKTNSKLNIPHLEWQMGLYAMALESKGYTIKETKCLWLPKRKSGQWVEINAKSKDECLEVIEMYEMRKSIAK